MVSGETDVVVFNVVGEKVFSAITDTVDLSMKACGVYIIIVDGVSCKVIR